MSFARSKMKFLLGQEFDNQYLTQRELDVLQYVVIGYTAKRIGRALNLSYRTVEAYIEILKVKLHCQTKAEIIELSFKKSWIIKE